MIVRRGHDPVVVRFRRAAQRGAVVEHGARDITGATGALHVERGIRARARRLGVGMPSAGMPSEPGVGRVYGSFRWAYAVVRRRVAWSAQ